MTKFNVRRARKSLQDFDFQTLFIEDLGWNYPPLEQAAPLEYEGVVYTRRPIAELAGVLVFEITPEDRHSAGIYNATVRAAVQTQIAQHFHENLLIFVDERRTQSIWYWVKREGGKRRPRSHYYVKGQTGDLFLGKLASMFVDIGELDEEGNLPVVEAARRVRDSFDVERVTKKFYDEFQGVQAAFQAHIQGIPDEGERRWYTSVILNRLMFVYFLQRKGFVDRDMDYLSHKLEAFHRDDAHRDDAHWDDAAESGFYRGFLLPLFFEGFAKPAELRDPATRELLGDVRYLNGGLFLPHPIEEKYGAAVHIPGAAFTELFDLFKRYSWNLDDTPGGQDDEINPAVLGYIFEKYINQKAFGAYYTREEITEYLCEQTIHRLILDKVAEFSIPVPGLPEPPVFDSVPELLLGLDANLCSTLLNDILPNLSLLDPACGSGAFLVAALKTLVVIYEGVIGRIPFLKDAALDQWLARARQQHPSLAYFIKKRVITGNLYGVDIMPEAVEIARLRLFLALVASAQSVDDLEPLPNIDFNILPGNSLIGLLRVDDTQYQVRLGEDGYNTLVARKNAMVQQYRNAAQDPELRENSQAVAALRDQIEEHRRATNATLNGILLDRFKKLKIQYEQATWNAKQGRLGRAKKRVLTLADIEALQPFHWGYEFHEVLNERGGFDAIITNPPWEALKPQDKEFFAGYSDVVTKKKMTIGEFKKERKELMGDPDIKAAYLDYLSRFPHQSAYFRSAHQYSYQRTEVNGRTTGSDVNFYKLFTEQCYNLLRQGGECGTVIPSGIYTDLGATGLRKLLFARTRITALFGFENRKAIFEDVHRSFKFVVLTFAKGGPSALFPATFMRHAVTELEHFPQEGAVMMHVDLIKKLSPGSWSMMEFSSELDIAIAKKLLRYPALGETLPDSWNVQLSTEFHMTNHSHLFYTEPGPGRLPLYEGKMIHQFTHQWGEPRYWVAEAEGRAAVLGRTEDTGQKLDYQMYRAGFRAVGESTNTRNFIVTVIPLNVFCGNSLIVIDVLGPKVTLFLCALMNSFILDYALRMKIARNINMFYVYQLPIPRLTESDPVFRPIVERAARLICTTPEFDELAQEIGVTGTTDSVERAQLRAELDGIIAHVYGLTEDEFRHILGTFPLVEEQVKQAALQAYRERG